MEECKKCKNRAWVYDQIDITDLSHGKMRYGFPTPQTTGVAIDPWCTDLAEAHGMIMFDITRNASVRLHCGRWHPREVQVDSGENQSPGGWPSRARVVESRPRCKYERVTTVRSRGFLETRVLILLSTLREWMIVRKAVKFAHERPWPFKGTARILTIGSSHRHCSQTAHLESRRYSRFARKSVNFPNYWGGKDCDPTYILQPTKCWRRFDAWCFSFIGVSRAESL